MKPLNKGRSATIHTVTMTALPAFRPMPMESQSDLEATIAEAGSDAIHSAEAIEKAPHSA